jgi:ferredoxin
MFARVVGLPSVIDGYNIRFQPESHPAITLTAGANLSEHLTINNSPILFGCRTGICGPCLIEVVTRQDGTLTDPTLEERELLDIVDPDNPRARLACQIALCADITITYLGA